MYWLIALLQDQPSLLNLDIGYIEILIGLIIGLTPQLLSAFKDRRRWFGGEKKVVEQQAGLHQSEAVENIASAAAMVAEQSQRLSEKNAALIATYEAALQRQGEMLVQERQQNKELILEIERLKIQVQEINENIVVCSREIVSLVLDIQNGKKITPERLESLEETWKKYEN